MAQTPFSLPEQFVRRHRYPTPGERRRYKSGGGGTNTVQTVSGPPAEVLQNYNNIYAQAKNVAAQPSQQYNGAVLAGFTPMQQAGFNAVNTAANAGTPFINQASQYATNAATSLDPSHFAGTVGAYQSPYTQAVVDATQRQFNNNNAIQQNQLAGNAASQGAFGGDRQAVAQAVLAGQQQAQQAPAIANLYNTGFQNATNAAQSNAWLNSQGAFSMGNLGNEAQQQGFAAANAMLGAGAAQQAQAQQELNIPYQSFLGAQAYPYQSTGWLSNLALGLGAGSGSVGSQSSPGPSTSSQLLGAGLSTAGLLNNTGAFGANGWLTGSSAAGAGSLVGGTDAALAASYGASGAADAATAYTAEIAAAELAAAHRGGKIPFGGTRDLPPVPVRPRGFDAGGGVGMDTSTPGLMASVGGSPALAQMLETYNGLPTEKLQEMAMRLPPSTTQGAMAHRALQMRQASPQGGPKPAGVPRGPTPPGMQMTAPPSGQGGGQQQPELGTVGGLSLSQVGGLLGRSTDDAPGYADGGEVDDGDLPIPPIPPDQVRSGGSRGISLQRASDDDPSVLFGPLSPFGDGSGAGFAGNDGDGGVGGFTPIGSGDGSRGVARHGDEDRPPLVRREVPPPITGRREEAPSHWGDTLLMAGLGMMAGTSPFPLVNVGKGGMEGMQYAAQQRQRDQADALHRDQLDANTLYRWGLLNNTADRNNTYAQSADARHRDRQDALDAVRARNDQAFQVGMLRAMNAQNSADAGRWSYAGTDPASGLPIMINGKTAETRLGTMPIGMKPGEKARADQGDRRGDQGDRRLDQGDRAGDQRDRTGDQRDRQLDQTADRDQQSADAGHWVYAGTNSAGLPILLNTKSGQSKVGEMSIGMKPGELARVNQGDRRGDQGDRRLDQGDRTGDQRDRALDQQADNQQQILELRRQGASDADIRAIAAQAVRLQTDIMHPRTAAQAMEQATQNYLAAKKAVSGFSAPAATPPSSQAPAVPGGPRVQTPTVTNPVTQPTPRPLPKAGDVVRGYTYKGGPPDDPTSWQKVQ